MKKIIAIVITALAVSNAFGEEIAMNQHTGPYVELGLGTNLYYWGVISSSGNTNGAGVTGVAVSGAYGYNFINTFALEGGFIEDFVDVNRGSTVSVPYVTTRFTAPLGDRFSFIGKIGLMVPFVPGEGGLVLPYTGIGVSYAATRNVDVSLQYQGAVYGIAGAGIAGLGLTYHFS